MSDEKISELIENLKTAFDDKFPNTSNSVFVKDASTDSITSLHLIVHLKTEDDKAIYV